MSKGKDKSGHEKRKGAAEKRFPPIHGIYGEISGEVQEFLKLVRTTKKRGAVLDLGCNDGKNAIFFARHGFEGHGVDSHAESIKRARAYASRTGVSESTHFRVGNVFTLPYPSRFFDVVIDYGCLHHIHKKEWDNYLECILKILKPHSYYMLTVYSLRDRHVPTRKRQYVVHQGHYDYFFSKKEIRTLFKEDFKIIKITEEAAVTPEGVRHAFYHAQMKRLPQPDDT